QTDCEKSQFVTCFRECQPFGVRPGEFVCTLRRAIRWIEERNEFYELRLRSGLGEVDQLPEREPVPGNNHRPGFDTAVSIIPPFNSTDQLDQFVKRKFARACAQAGNLEDPRLRFPTVICLILWLIFAGTPFV